MMRLNPEMITPKLREIIIDATSARCKMLEINKPLSPSVTIIPIIKKRPKTPENSHPESSEAEIEKRVI